jgi:cell fate (sporulation/competence/biofilm development) regulator YlbF (YheA/YmcA/DUF963 family)
MNDIDNAMDQLILAVRESAVYREYREQLERVKAYPELKKQIDEFRARNYEWQNSTECALEQLEFFEREYEKFREDPLVADFLEAELAFCRMMQDINIRLTESVQFE